MPCGGWRWRRHGLQTQKLAQQRLSVLQLWRRQQRTRSAAPPIQLWRRLR
jgi:hypothetical protein